MCNINKNIINLQQKKLLMFIDNIHRKTMHIFLFVLVILIQFVIFFLWYNQNEYEVEFSESLKAKNITNKALLYSNESSKYYFEAENNFLEYFHHYDNASLINYKTSLSTMSIYLDSLSNLISADNKFRKDLNSKKYLEKQIIQLRLELDNILNLNNEEKSLNILNKIHHKPFKYDALLSSISYDTIRIDDEIVKKSFLARLGDAIRGTVDVKREELQITMKILYGKDYKTGSIEDQFINIFETTNNYYSKEYNQLKKTYSNLKDRDIELLIINKKILSNSQQILNYYNKKIQTADQENYQSALINIDKKRNLIVVLLIIMVLCTITLIIYTVYAYIYEKKLAIANTKLEQNLQFKNRIIGMLSHEMRAPLNIISNLSKKFKKKNKELIPEESTNLLHFTSKSLQITVDQILAFCKNENEKPILYNSSINLKQEIKSILDSLRTLAQAKNIDLDYNLDEKLNQQLGIDIGKLHQLFYNLIGNSLKFTEKGSIKINAKLNTDSNKNILQITIKDTGIGIPEEDLDKIFQKYYQSKNSQEKISFGAGLGLSLCKEIVELYSGEITISSIVGQGTKIQFELELEPIDSNFKSNLDKIKEFTSKKNIEIAVLDDDKIVLLTLKKMLNDANINTEIFTSVEEANLYFAENQPHILITDLQINQNSGEEFIKNIRNNSPLNTNIPIIIITGDQYVDHSDLQKLAANDIIIKPVNKEELYEKINKILNI